MWLSFRFSLSLFLFNNSLSFFVSIPLLVLAEPHARPSLFHGRIGQPHEVQPPVAAAHKGVEHKRNVGDATQPLRLRIDDTEREERIHTVSKEGEEGEEGEGWSCLIMAGQGHPNLPNNNKRCARRSAPLP